MLEAGDLLVSKGMPMYVVKGDVLSKAAEAG